MVEDFVWGLVTYMFIYCMCMDSFQVEFDGVVVEIIREQVLVVGIVFIVEYCLLFSLGAGG